MKKIVELIDSFHKITCKVLVNLATIALIMMTSAIVMQVVLRYFFKAPITWVEEFAVYLMLWMSYLCLPYLVYMEKNVVMELIYGKFKKTKIKYIFDIFYICFIVFIAVSYLPYAVRSFEQGLNIKANLLPLKLGVIRIIIPISLTLTITVSLQKLIVSLMKIFNVNYASSFFKDPFENKLNKNNIE